MPVTRSVTLLDTDVILDLPGPGNNQAFGHCTVDLATFNGGSVLGRDREFTWFQASVALSYLGRPQLRLGRDVQLRSARLSGDLRHPAANQMRELLQDIGPDRRGSGPMNNCHGVEHDASSGPLLDHDVPVMALPWMAQSYWYVPGVVKVKVYVIPLPVKMSLLVKLGAPWGQHAVRLATRPGPGPGDRRCPRRRCRPPGSGCRCGRS